MSPARSRNVSRVRTSWPEGSYSSSFRKAGCNASRPSASRPSCASNQKAVVVQPAHHHHRWVLRRHGIECSHHHAHVPLQHRAITASSDRQGELRTIPDENQRLVVGVLRCRTARADQGDQRDGKRPQQAVTSAATDSACCPELVTLSSKQSGRYALSEEPLGVSVVERIANVGLVAAAVEECLNEERQLPSVTNSRPPRAHAGASRLLRKGFHCGRS
jgi:hypothetical protein